MDAATTLSTAGLGQFAVDDAGVVWFASEELLTCPSSGCEDGGVPIITVDAGVEVIAVGEGQLYWLTNTDEIVACPRAPVASCGANAHVRVPVEAGLGMIDRFAIDSTGIYWIAGGAVTRQGLDGGALVTVVAGRSQPDNVTLGATCVFWSESASTGTSSLMAIGK
jgi:hypothetical protein